MIYIDNSMHVENLEEAIKLGKENEQWAIWDNAKGEQIDLNVREKVDNN